MYRPKLLLLLLSFCCTVPLFAQNIEITGRVADEVSGAPLPGVSIHVKGNNGLTKTDQEGKYRVSATVGETLVFRFIGYKTTEVAINAGRNQVDVNMAQDVNQLNEVVVTGALGLKRSAREMGSATAIVDNEYLNLGKTVNPINGLASKVSSLRINVYDSKVDPQIQVRLRGSRSLSRNAGANDPIYVVDGIPVPDINRINPNDIANITVLKGANAAALYGSEGVNGAIMIETKKGKTGGGNIRFSNSTLFSNVMLLPPAQTSFGQGTGGEYSATQFESWGPAFDGSTRPFGPQLPDGTQPDLVYSAPGRDGRLDLFNTGLNVQNDLSFTGGNENSTYFVSLQDVRIKGVIPEDEGSRTGARFNGSRKFGKLNTSYTLNYIYNNNNTTPDGPWITAYQLPANFPYQQMENWQDRGTVADPMHFFTDLQQNPYFQIGNYRNNTKQQTFNGKMQFDYEFTDWFSAMYRFGMYATTAESRNTVGRFEAEGRRNVNGSVTDGSDNFRRYNSDLILNFKKQFGDISTKLLLGNNIRADHRKDASIGSGNLLFPDLFNPASRIGELNGSSAITDVRSTSVYGEFTAGYKNYLFVTFTGRNDWTSLLAQQNRSFFYPGVSTSFIASDAIQSIKDSRTVDFLKFFGSWNRTGNVTLNPYQLNNPYSQINGFPFGGQIGFSPSTLFPDPLIEPEFVSSVEAGFQLGMFSNRLNIEANYVYSDSDGQILNAVQSAATGYRTALVNAGNLTNNIVEASISGDLIRKSDFGLNIGVVYSYTNNQVKSLYGSTDNQNVFRQSYAVVNQAFPTLRVNDYQRDNEGNVVVDADGDPVVSNDLVDIGTMVPPHMLGINTNIRYKGFNLGAQFDWRMGAWIYSEIVPRMYNAGTHPATVYNDRQPFVWPNSVIQNADGTYSPNTTPVSSTGRSFWAIQGAVQSNTVAKGDYFKLRELNLSYNLPSKWLTGQKSIKAASIGFVANNLFIIRHSSNDLGDPEMLYNQTDGYISFRQVPPYRTYGFNINVEF
ncbi:SusC/RagA family TonB-linked outer membrane protein [Olivibacter sp. SDN3]|uniref:SusC/RagA family TonB-linked outer membrane protein n=1 Tax=Olivibacter sp. SDN3 TaxID=2764720 RepID=UPI0016512062|nr:SusC/RagA family TonB-linked outer membrane protein [Olivibacter sp. SDN3]QNL49615.1 SusC/RagA family TonB-linked outer membrane protein [Olivibacter sp. SDN3]